MPEDVKGRKPTHTLKMVAKNEHGKFFTVGAGWETETGISLSLNKGVTLTWRDIQDHALYIFKDKPTTE